MKGGEKQMPNGLCVTCHYQEHDLSMRNLEYIQRRLNNIDISKVQRPHHYNWSNNNKCKYGMSCNKTQKYSQNFKRITENLDYLLTGFIEQTDCSNYHEILMFLRGTFPSVYRDFEHQVMCKKAD